MSFQGVVNQEESRNQRAVMIGSCPECNEAIRIPEGKSDQQVRCPLCTAEYDLESVLKSLPPMLEMVGGSSADIGIQIESASDLELGSAETNQTRTSSTKKYTPQKRKQSSPLWEIVKVILGGALALPIGVLCVWWFAGRAPFGLSETVSEYVPWIVPEKLRKGDSVDDSDLDSLNGEPKNKESQKVSASKQKANRSLKNSNTQGGGLNLNRSIEFGDNVPKKLNQQNGSDEEPSNKNKEPASKGDSSEIQANSKKTDGKNFLPDQNRPDLNKKANAKKTIDQKTIDQKNIDEKNIDQKTSDAKSRNLETSDANSSVNKKNVKVPVDTPGTASKEGIAEKADQKKASPNEKSDVESNI